MTSFLIRRLLAAIPISWAALTAAFLLLQMAPGSAFHDVEGPGVDRESAARLRRLTGADRPMTDRYFDWLAGAARGDFGPSLSHRRPVRELIAESAANTFRLAGAAMALQFVLGAAAGVTAAGTGRRRLGRIVTAAAAAIYSIPSFCLGMALVWALSVRLEWLPASQMRGVGASELGAGQRTLDALLHLALPCLSLALPAAGGIALYVRDEMAAILESPYVLASQARGFGKARVLWIHGLRNAAQPLMTLLGLALPGLVGGSVVIEVLFAWPGLGRLAYQAVLARDEPLVLGCALAGTGLVILGSLLADIASGWADPRLRGSLR